jgi:hypothetical protein
MAELWFAAAKPVLPQQRLNAGILGTLCAIAIGAAAFVLVCGINTLRPANIAWLGAGDPAQHYLGWVFFRRSGWNWPPGASPDWGLELASSVAYSDSIPLLAIPLKAVSWLLPEPFQYFGIWLLACFVLQAILARKLAKALAMPESISLLFAAMAVFMPAFLWRLHGHESLLGHWVILWSLFLYARPGKHSPIAWTFVLFVATMIHAYLFMMVFAVGAAELLKRLLTRDVGYFRLILLALLGVASSGAGLWLAGFFEISSGFQDGGFGYYRMDVLSPVDASDWSYILPDIPDDLGEYEGFNFFGVGFLMLTGIACIAFTSRRVSVSLSLWWTPLFLAMCVLTMIAWSSAVSMGPIEVLTNPLAQIGGVARASGRMFWPVSYCILLASVVLVARVGGTSFAGILIAILLVVQIADTRAGWSQFRQKFATVASGWNSPLKSPLWQAAAPRYKKVRRLVPGNGHAGWKEISYYAALNGMATDAVYMARVDRNRVQALVARTNKDIEAGTLETDSLYVVDADVVDRLRPHVGAGDLLTQADGYWVFAIGGADLAPSRGP